MARVTGLEPATFGVTGRRSNQLSYTRVGVARGIENGPLPVKLPLALLKNAVMPAAMAYFKNKSINLVYFHAALQGLAFFGGEFFAFAFLLKAGVPLVGVILSIGLLYGGRVFLRMLVVPFVKWAGLRNGLFLGIGLEAVSYLVLSQVTGVGPLLYCFLFSMSLSSSFYWTTMHAYVAKSGDAEHRGAQVSATEFINTLVGIVAPLVSGYLLSHFHPIVAFGVTAGAMLGSAVPFLFTENTRIPEKAELPVETRREARLIMFTDGLRTGWHHYVWLLVLFTTLGESFGALGVAMSLSGLVGGIFGLVAGKSIDLGHGKRARQIAYSVMAMAGLARAVGYPLPWSAIGANALAVLAWPMYGTVLNGRLYDLAKQSPCTLRYHVVAEGGWDIGCALACLIAAGMIWMGLPFFWPLILSVIASYAGYVVMSRSFAGEKAT
jgi:MFS transporter, DHA1 family, inner membrane transport protein